MPRRRPDPTRSTQLREWPRSDALFDDFMLPAAGSPDDCDHSAPTVLSAANDLNDTDDFEYTEPLPELSRYAIDDEIARGGMGVILRARDLHLDREVAIKLLHRRLRNRLEFRERFIAEAKITGQLQHPGIVPVYDVGFCEDQRPYFVMKLVDGETFARFVREAKRSALERYRCLKVFEKVCNTIAYAHSQGIVHLDIKPSNVMVGTFGEVHVMDWGLSAAWDQQRVVCVPGELADESEPGISPCIGEQISGTPSYMSPEQARSGLIDPRSDVFGLGGLLCEIMTGQPPFRGQNVHEVCSRAAWAQHDDALAALSRCEGDEGLVQLASRCLAADPDDRPEHAGEVAFEVTSILETATDYAQTDLFRFFELSMDMFCIASLDGYFHRVNANFTRVLGYSRREMLSRPVTDFIHPDDHHKTLRAFEVLRTGHPVVRFSNRYKNTSGEYRTLEWTAKSIPEENTAFAVARDVTEFGRR